MDTSDNPRSKSVQGQHVLHPHLRREGATAHQAFLVAFYTELNEYNWDHPEHGWDDGYSDAFAPSELLKAIEKGNRAYENTLLRMRRVRQ